MQNLDPDKMGGGRMAEDKSVAKHNTINGQSTVAYSILQYPNHYKVYSYSQPRWC